LKDYDRFKTYKEFVSKHIEIKIIYEMMTLEERIEFKKYVYSLKMGEYKKNRIWEYLNNDKKEELLYVIR
jgi:hypothetical protein